MKNSYLVKYAALEVREYYNDNDYDLYYVLGYIASKCYVLESITKYYENKSKMREYTVVFPYNNISVFEENLKNDLKPYLGDEVYPSNYYDRKNYPVNFVLKVFDSFEEAKKEAETLNNNLLTYLISPLTTSEVYEEEYNEVKQNFLNNMLRCERFENMIKEETKFPEVENKFKMKNNFIDEKIILSNNKIKKLKK